MELSNEDAFRLNVLLANELLALRIDESSMSVHGLSNEGETTVRLNPTGRDEKYLRQVRELISTQVLGSPGGYPVFLKRWTRMGQARDNSLERLLLLGEPEAVVAVVHAEGLDPEIARRAWWAMQTADNARQMLQRDCVVNSPLGREMAQFLIEYLPFETEAQDIIDSVRLVLQPGLTDEHQSLNIWKRGKHKNTYYVGFLLAVPDELPEQGTAHPEYKQSQDCLDSLRESGNRFADTLCRIYSPSGQAFLDTVKAVMKRPANQEVVSGLMNAIGAYFSPGCTIEPETRDDLAVLESAARQYLDAEENTPGSVAELLSTYPQSADVVTSMVTLSMVTENIVTPVFARTDAIGSLMRRKLEPVTTPLMVHIERLSGTGAS